jgi:hypothetical protein
LSVAVLIRKTSLPSKLVTARRLPSGEMASLCGVSPTSISPMMPLVAGVEDRDLGGHVVRGVKPSVLAEGDPVRVRRDGDVADQFLAAVSITSTTFSLAPLIAVLWFGT